MKAICTWGEGPDVLVVLEGKACVLYEDPTDKDRFKHGVVKNGSLDLTSEEAFELGFSIIKAAQNAVQLDLEYSQYLEHDFLRKQDGGVAELA